jgi:hypothetical protein
LKDGKDYYSAPFPGGGTEYTVEISTGSDDFYFSQDEKREGDPIFTYNLMGPHLPHLDLLEKIGDSVDRLLFAFPDSSYGSKFGNIMNGEGGRRDQHTIYLATGGFLNHIIKYCPNLTHLVIELSRIIALNSLSCGGGKSSFSTSITDLILREVDLYEPTVMEDISRRLVFFKEIIT